MNNVQDNQREANLAYLAGILDGEGCFTIKCNKRSETYFTTVSVGMTELPAIELMVEMFGGVIRKDSSGRGRAMYRWESNSAPRNREILEAVMPYLRVKKEQARTLLECINTIREVGGGASTSSATKQFRKELYLRIKELKTAAPATTKRENSREVEAIV